MRLSKKSRYALIALIDLSVNSKYNHVALNNIAERNNMSPQYLEQGFASLRKAGIVKSIKGAQGGYLLGADPKNITVAAVLEAVDGTYKIEHQEMSDHSSNPAVSIIIQTSIIDKINQRMEELMENITLADLESDYQDYNEYNQQMYYI